MPGAPAPSRGGEACPTAQELFDSANQRLVAVRESHAWSRDEDLLAAVLPDWDTVAVARGLPPDFGGPRMLMRHRSHGWVVLIYPHNGGNRLLMGREYKAIKDFRFTDDQSVGCTMLVGTEDTIFDYVVTQHRRLAGRWNTDVLLWFFDHLPGERAEAERLMLGLWFSQ